MDSWKGEFRSSLAFFVHGTIELKLPAGAFEAPKACGDVVVRYDGLYRSGSTVRFRPTGPRRNLTFKDGCQRLKISIDRSSSREIVGTYASTMPYDAGTLRIRLQPEEPRWTILTFLQRLVDPRTA